MPTKRRKTTSLIKRLGPLIKQSRLSNGLSQQQLAERVGVESETISRIERGAVLPSLAKLEQIAGALDESLADLVGPASPLVKDQAQTIAVWLDGMSDNDRNFVLSVTKAHCDFLTLKQR